MRRRSGEIPPIKRERFPSSLLVFDTEAYRSGFKDGVEIQSLRMGVAYYMKIDDELSVVDDHYTRFTTVSELVEFIEWHVRKDRALYVYAHNLKYDLQLSGLLTELLGRAWSVGLFVVDDPPTFIRLKRGRSSILFVDTFNYWQFSLAKMGEQLSLAKLTIPNEGASIDEWFTYCKRDVEVLSEYLLSFMRFLKVNDLAGLGLTLASQAFRSFRHRFMSTPIVIHTDERVLKLERDGYSGGRVEAFVIGHRSGERFFKLDVNSMYPFVMRSNEFPVDLVSYSENVPVSKLPSLTDRYYCLAEVELDSLVPLYAFKGREKLTFPVGCFRTTLHHSEILYALRRHHITQVFRLAIYDRSPIFTPYVDFFYDLKLRAETENNPVLRHQAKIFLNSLYGKFGQRNFVSEIVDNPQAPSFGRMTGYSQALGTSVVVNRLGDVMEIRYKRGESAYSFPAIAGGVTALARVYLWELIDRAGRSEVFYVDTDSLIVSALGYDRLRSYLDDRELGKLKLESSGDDLIITGAKDYAFSGEVKHKGIPKSAIKLSENSWKYEQFRGFKTWISDGLRPGVEVYERIKERRSAYDKGTVDEDGRVSPFLLGYGRENERG